MFLAILGRQPHISLAELESLYGSTKIKPLAENLALVDSPTFNLSRLGGTIKAGQILETPLIEYLINLPPGKITIGLSDYASGSTAKSTRNQALKLKSILKRHHRSARIVPTGTNSPILSSATSHHNQLGEKTNHIEIIKYQKYTAISIGTQNITAYAKRDQARPARDAFVGMLPPKLAQILINLATGPAQKGRLLDPFCGTGTILQEALLMGYAAYGTDLSEKMISYSQKNLNWLLSSPKHFRESNGATPFGETVEEGRARPYFQPDCEGLTPVKTGCHPERFSPKGVAPLDSAIKLESGDATKFKWEKPIDFIASETYLGQPFSAPPSDPKLKEVKHITGSILLAFLKNLHPQIKSGTPLALAIPAWRRPSGEFSHLDIIDEISKLGYNVHQFKHATPTELLYHREDQVVARQIIVLKKA